jgi:hypothetical protein
MGDDNFSGTGSAAVSKGYQQQQENIKSGHDIDDLFIRTGG